MTPKPRSGMVATTRYFGNEVDNVGSQSAFWRPRRRIIFLIHGYNVSTASAHDTLAQFEQQILETPHGGLLVQDLAWFTWPGDMSGLGYVLSAPFYSLILKRAPLVGSNLGQWLLELRDLYRRQQQQHELEVIFIAHSLGCRVTLEAIKHIRTAEACDPKPTTIKIFLMAAAVPVADLQRGGKLRPAVEHAVERALMHSEKDRALGLVFKAGQALVSGESGGPAAGKTGEPSELWGNSSFPTPWGHGDYWKRGFRTFLAWLGYPGPRSLPLAPVARTDIPRHELAVYRTTLRR